MRLLSKQEFGGLWRGISTTRPDVPDSREDVHIANIEKQPAHALAYHARVLAAWVSRLHPEEFPARFAGEGLVLITEWSVWESSEHFPLYADWRDLNAGAARPNALTLESHPGHHFSPDEFGPAIGLLMISLAFGWGLRIGDTGTGRHLMFNHDGTVFASLTGSNEAEHERLRKSLR